MVYKLAEVTGETLPFQDGDLAINVVYIIVDSVGIVAWMLVLVAMARNISPTQILNISLCISDLFQLTASFVHMASNFYHNGWKMGHQGCVTYEIFAVVSAITSGLTLTAIAVDRYLTIFHDHILTTAKALKVTFALWFIAFQFALYPYYFGTSDYSVAMTSAKTQCTLNWQTPTTLDTAIVAFLLCLIFASFNTMVFVYFKIVTIYLRRDKTKKVAGTQTATQQQVKDANATSLEKKLTIKAIALTLNFVGILSPYVLAMMYEMISKQNTAPSFDATVGLLFLSSSVLNPILFYYFDARIKRSVNDLLGIKPPTEQRKQKKQEDEKPVEIDMLNEMDTQKIGSNKS